MRVNIPEKNTYIDFPDDMPPEQAQLYIESNWDSIKDPNLLPYNVDLKRSSSGMQARQRVDAVVNAPPSVLTQKQKEGIADVVQSTKTPPPPTFSDGVKQAFKSIGAGQALEGYIGQEPDDDFNQSVREASITGQAGAALLRGAVAWPVSKIVGGYVGLTFGGEMAKKTEQGLQAIITQAPDNEQARSVMESAGKVLGLPFAPAIKAGEWLEENVNPTVGYLVGSALEVATPSLIHAGIKNTVRFGQMYRYIKADKEMPSFLKAELDLMPQETRNQFMNVVDELKRQDPGTVVDALEQHGLSREIAKKFTEDIADIPVKDTSQNHRALLETQNLDGLKDLSHQYDHWRSFADALEEVPGKPSQQWKDLGFTSARDAYETFKKIAPEKKPFELDEDFVAEEPSALDSFLAQSRKAIEDRIDAQVQRGSFSTEPVAGEPFKYEFVNKDAGVEIRLAQGLPKPSKWEIIKGAYDKVRAELTQVIDGIPHDGNHGNLEYALIRLKKAKSIEGTNTIQFLRDITEGLKSYDMDLFSQKVIFDDLRTVSEQGKKVPFGLDGEKINAELANIDNIIANRPAVSDALTRRRAVWKSVVEDYTKSMKDLGVDVSSRFTNDTYFRHQILEYAQAKSLKGTGQALQTPTNRGFLKKREGSEMPFNTDYLQAEYEVMAQMLYDTQVAKVLKMVDKEYNIAKSVEKGTVPEGYAEWQPRKGNAFFMTDSIPAKLADELKLGKLEEIGITADDLRSVLAVGGKRKQFIIPEEIANALDNFGKADAGGAFSELSRNLMTSWKVWTLVSPRRWFKYNMRNLTGDADAAFIGNPRGFKKVPEATRDLFNHFFRDKPMSKRLEEYFNEGGFESTLQAQELSDINSLKVFKQLSDSGQSITEGLNVWQKYWKAARLTTDFREHILRFANFIDYMEQLEKGGGKPKNYGASVPEVIDALKTNTEKAFWLQNDLLGAYDRVSILGQSIRQHFIPFWSWKEVNFKRYIQFAKNAWNDGRMASAVGHKLLGEAIKSPYTAFRIGSFVGKALTLWAVLETWNNTMFPEAEKALSPDEQSRPHIVLGKSADGKTMYFNRIGALGDFLEWFGMDTPRKDVEDLFSGRRTLLDIAKDMAQSPVNVIVQGANPLVVVKPGVELLSRRALFPNAFHPTIIRDRGLYLAKSFALENEYKALVGLPSRGYANSLKGIFLYESDPGETEYSNAFLLKNQYLKKIGKESESFYLSDKASYLYNVKLALRYGDEDAFVKYLERYKQAGGTRKGFNDSIKHMHPLSGLSAKEKRGFYDSLSEDDRGKVQRAIDFYDRVIKGNYKEGIKK